MIVDFVINHTSVEHPWFQDALDGGLRPRRLVHLVRRRDPGVARPGGGPASGIAIGDGDFYYGSFWEGMPDLNLANPDVTAELDGIAGFWLEEIGVDGFRMDAAKHLIEDGPRRSRNTPETLAWLAGFQDRDQGATTRRAGPRRGLRTPRRCRRGYVPRRLARPDVRLRAAPSATIVAAVRRGGAAPDGARPRCADL